MENHDFTNPKSIKVHQNSSVNCPIKSKKPGGFSQVQQQIQAREEMLQPLYTQVACEFADLHDRAGRMKAVGAIKESTLDVVLMHVLANMNHNEHYVSWCLLEKCGMMFLFLVPLFSVSYDLIDYLMIFNLLFHGLGVNST
jgi:hypothetical protein